MKQISQNIGTHKLRQRRIESTSTDASNPLVHTRHPLCIRTEYACIHDDTIYINIYKVYKSYRKPLLSKTVIDVSD